MIWLKFFLHQLQKAAFPTTVLTKYTQANARLQCYTQFGKKFDKLSALFGLRYENSRQEIYQRTTNQFEIKKESLLFLSAGWVVTVGWYVGNTDVLAVLLAIYLFDSVNKENTNWVKVFIFSSLLTFSHYGLAFFIIFSIVILLINEYTML